MVEREKKFLVLKAPAKLNRYRHDIIHQGYLVRTPAKIEIRIRQRANQFTLTVKHGEGETRLEEEIKISKSKFHSLWKLTKGKRLEKIRYVIPYGKYKIELDRYQGKLKGLLTAEVEFPSASASKKFKAPEWFGKEVTSSGKYSNWVLATSGLKLHKKR
jgi:adenylate cyclase